MDCVIPLPMKIVLNDIDFVEQFVRYCDALRILSRIKLRLNLQTGLCCCCGNQVHNNLIADEWFASPVLSYKREQFMLNFVPLAGAWRQMTHTDRQPGFVCEALKLDFPKSNAITVAAASIGGYEQLSGVRIGWVAHTMPPRGNTVDSKRRRVVIDAHAYPTDVIGYVVNPVRRRLAQFWDYEIVNTNLLRLSFGTKFATAILEIADQFLLLCVHRDHRVSLRLERFHCFANVLKLRIPVGVQASLNRLLIGLETVAHFLQQVGYKLVAGPMPHILKFFGKFAHALASPQQRRLRIASCSRLDKGLQTALQFRVFISGALAPTSFFTNTARAGAGDWLIKFDKTLRYSATRNASLLRNGGHTAVAERFGFGGSEKSPHPFVQERRP